jgi:carbonic anhydrase
MTVQRASALIVATAGLSASFGVYAEEFQYTSDSGPAHWVELNDAWEACAGDAATARQSPIDLTKASFDKGLGRLQLRTFPTTIDIFNNVHTIEQHLKTRVARSISGDDLPVGAVSFPYTVGAHRRR